MVAKSCGTCEFWKVPVNNFGRENRTPGTWGECKKVSVETPIDGTFMVIHTPPPHSAVKPHLRTRAEFYCAHYETVTKEAKT